MCYDYETSRNTFILGTIGTIINLLKYKNNSIFTVLNIFWFFVISMQFWEALIWKDYKCKLTSKLAMINNIIQPLILLLVFLIPNYQNKNKSLIYFCTIIYILYISRYFKKDYVCIRKPSGIHLKWWDKYGTILYLSLSIFLFKILYSTKIANTQIGLFIGSLVIGYALAKNKKKSIGSIWCWVAAFTPYLNNYIFSKLI